MSEQSVMPEGYHVGMICYYKEDKRHKYRIIAHRGTYEGKPYCEIAGVKKIDPFGGYNVYYDQLSKADVSFIPEEE